MNGPLQCDAASQFVPSLAKFFSLLNPLSDLSSHPYTHDGNVPDAYDNLPLQPFVAGIPAIGDLASGVATGARMTLTGAATVPVGQSMILATLPSTLCHGRKKRLSYHSSPLRRPSSLEARSEERSAKPGLCRPSAELASFGLQEPTIQFVAQCHFRP